MENGELLNTLIIFLFGLVFGAVAVFLHMNDKLKTLQAITAQRRISLMEQVAQHVGKVSHVFGKYSSLVNEIGTKVERMSAGQKQELDSLSSQLVDVYEEVAIAESKLLLLGEQKLEKALKLYTAKMALFRKQIYPGRYSNDEEAAQLKREVTLMRSQFYDVLSQRYDQKTS